MLRLLRMRSEICKLGLHLASNTQTTRLTSLRQDKTYAENSERISYGLRVEGQMQTKKRSSLRQRLVALLKRRKKKWTWPKRISSFKLTWLGALHKQEALDEIRDPPASRFRITCKSYASRLNQHASTLGKSTITILITWTSFDPSFRLTTPHLDNS